MYYLCIDFVFQFIVEKYRNKLKQPWVRVWMIIQGWRSCPLFWGVKVGPCHLIKVSVCLLLNPHFRVLFWGWFTWMCYDSFQWKWVKWPPGMELTVFITAVSVKTVRNRESTKYLSGYYQTIRLYFAPMDKIGCILMAYCYTQKIWMD